MGATLMMGVNTFAAGIESANVVGYTTTNVAANTWIILGSQFQTTTNSSLNIQDFIKGNFSAVESGVLATAPQMQIHNGTRLLAYYYISDAWYDDGSAEGAYKTAWVDSDQAISDLTIAPGTAVWFKNPTAATTITLAGQVGSGTASSLTTRANSWSLIANPYPVSFSLNDATAVTWGITPGTSGALASAPQMQVHNGTRLLAYYYISDAWYDDGSAEGAYKTAWVDSDQAITDLSIKAGQGFWFKAPTVGTITFLVNK